MVPMSTGGSLLLEAWKPYQLDVNSLFCFEMRSHFVALADLKLYVDPAGLELTMIQCLCLLNVGIKGVHQHTQLDDVVKYNPSLPDHTLQYYKLS